MTDFWNSFGGPFSVAVLAGLALYLVQFKRQQYTIRAALRTEINALLREIDDYKKYLSLGGHAWLKVGSKLSESPLLARSQYIVFRSLLPTIHLLSKSEIERTLAFYSHHEHCESLIEILFGRIKQQEKSGLELSHKDVEKTKFRIDRIRVALDSGGKVTNGCIEGLGELPLQYEVYSAGETAEKMKHLFESEHDDS